MTGPQAGPHMGPTLTKAIESMYFGVFRVPRPQKCPVKVPYMETKTVIWRLLGQSGMLQKTFSNVVE